MDNPKLWKKTGSQPTLLRQLLLGTFRWPVRWGFDIRVSQSTISFCARTPLWGHLTLIDGNHKLAEACIDKKDTVRILTLTRDEVMECLLPESQKLASLVASALTRIGLT